MTKRRCCHTGTEAGKAVFTLADKTRRELRWCHDHLEWARLECIVLLARSAFPGATEVAPQSERLFDIG